MAIIDTETINKIRNSVDIVDVISKYVSLSPKGKNYFGICPFHDDNNPSMSVSKEKQIYRCFSCGATGNVFTFIMSYENISFLEAVKKCADMSGISINIKTSDKKENTLNKVLYDIYDISEKFYQNNLNSMAGKEAKVYLKKRNINEDIIKEFGIGLSLKSNSTLFELLKNKGYQYNDLNRTGLFSKKNLNYTDIYYDRIMFPLWDLDGKVVGYSGRIYSNSNENKYLNTTGTDIFVKGELIYNYYRAKDECRKKNMVIVMEGFMDVIRAYSVGIKNVIAIMGTALTKNQAVIIKRMAKDVILCFDGDEAGSKATASAINEFLSIGVMPKIIRLNDNLDPDDYISKNGKELFLEKVNNPINVMEFKLNYLKKNKDLNKTSDLANYVKDIINELNKIDDDVLKEITIKKVSIESGLDPNFIKGKLEKPKVLKKESSIKEVKKNKYQKAEQSLLFYMLKYKEVIKIYNKKITFMPTDNYRKLALEISLFYDENDYINEADFMTWLEDDKILLETLGEIIALPLKEKYSLEEINDYIDVIKQYNINYKIKNLEEKLKNADTPSEKAKILDEILKIRKGDSND